MMYKTEILSLEEAKNTLDEYAYALLYRVSDMVLLPADQITEKDWQECTEARVFREDAELHVLLDGETKVIRVCDEEKEGSVSEEDIGLTPIIRTYYLSKQAAGGLPKGLSKVLVKQYLTLDEDGQVRIALTRLADIQ